MQKNIKYLISIILPAFIVLISAGSVSAQTAAPTIQYAKGATCGASGQGTCKSFCDPYENIDSSGPVSASGAGECGTANSGEILTCCVPTHCGSNSSGVGTCTSNTTCSGTSVIGINTSDCLPPKLCCVIPATPNTVTNEQSTFQPVTTQTNVFTNQTTQTNQTAPEGKTGGLVTCNGLDCSLCDLLTLIKNVINFLLGLIFALAAAFVVWGAIEIMTSGGDESKVSNGRGRMWTAVMGIAISLGAWLFIGTLLQVLTNSPSVLPWNSINCTSSPLNLKSYSTGNDNACTSKGGICQDQSTTCSGSFTLGGGCLSQTWATDKTGGCCIPNTSTSNTKSCDTSAHHQCYSDSSTMASQYKIVSGETCPSGQSCLDMTTPFNSGGNPQL